MNEFQRLEHWHRVCNDDDAEAVSLYQDLVVEEFNEWKSAPNTANSIKELADLIVVASGLIIAEGADLSVVMKIVNDSNFSKYVKHHEITHIDDENEYYRQVEPGLFALHRRSDGKMLKGPKYIKGDAERRIAEHLGDQWWSEDHE